VTVISTSRISKTNRLVRRPMAVEQQTLGQFMARFMKPKDRKTLSVPKRYADEKKAKQKQ